MKFKLTALIASLALTGCASLDKWSMFSDEQVEEKIAESEQQKEAMAELKLVEEPSGDLTPAQASVNFQQSYREQLLSNMGRINNQQSNKSRSVKNINYYVRGLMQELVGNMQYVNASTPIAVTSFVFLDSNFEKADLIGKQVAESFVHEVHKFGIPVLDFKTTGYVRVSPEGDFILTKDYLELDGELPIKYAVAGTMVKHLAGYLVNARIIGMQSKAVVASAQGFFPASVINSLISSNLNDGIPLSSDE
jgi:TolB-like protein